MWTWKVENQELTNNNHPETVENRYGRPQTKIVFEIEKLPTKEKREFIDSYTGNMFTYICNVYDKYQAEKDSLAKDSAGRVRTNSLKAWLKKNDPKHKVDSSYKYGHIYYQGMETSLYWEGEKYHPNNFIDVVFHNICIDLKEAERQYTLTHNPYYVAVKEWEKLGCHSFGNSIGSCSDGTLHLYSEDDSRLLTLEEIQILIEKSKQLVAYEQFLSQDAQLKF